MGDGKLGHGGRGVLLKGTLELVPFSLGFWVTIGEHSLPPTTIMCFLTTSPKSMGSMDYRPNPLRQTRPSLFSSLTCL